MALMHRAAAEFELGLQGSGRAVNSVHRYDFCIWRATVVAL